VIVHKSIHFAEASEAKKAIVDYASKHKGAIAYKKLAKLLLDDQATAKPA
jgi:cellulose biosynthesis protein BcsQ